MAAPTAIPANPICEETYQHYFPQTGQQRSKRNQNRKILKSKSVLWSFLLVHCHTQCASIHVYKTASTPQYLADLLQIYTPSCTLRSTPDARKLKIPLFKKKYSGQRSFSYQGPVTWNNLPFSIRHTHTPQLSHNWKPTCFPKPSNRTQFLMLFVFDFQSWDVSMVHVLLHCMSGLHWCCLLYTSDAADER